MKRRRWTSGEDDVLEVLWGEKRIQDIAARLGRGVGAVEHRARKLGLATPNRGTYSYNELLRRSGHSDSRVRSVLRLLRIRPPRKLAMNGRQRPSRHCAFTEEQVEAVLAKLREIPDGVLLYKPGKKLSAGGEWGVGQKPKACARCGRDDRPHFARGMDKRCYIAAWREKNGRRKTPAASAA